MNNANSIVTVHIKVSYYNIIMIVHLIINATFLQACGDVSDYYRAN